mgnify:CR=1 FL=1
MEKFADKIKDLLQEKRTCYEQLTELLKREREVIIAMDVDSLWQITGEKNETVKGIEALRSRMINLLDEHGIDHDMNLNSFRLSQLVRLIPGSPKEKADVEAERLSIDGQKDEIQRLASENQRYVGEYLEVIHDVLSTIVTLTGPEQYEIPGKLCESKQPNHFIQAEV